MVEKQTIIHMYRTRGYSKRAIARELCINRKTVHKVISEYESALRGSDPEASLETVLTTVPRYDSSKRGRRVIVGSLKDLIDDCLAGNERKRAMGLRKQCMRGKDIYELLLEKGFQSAIRVFVNISFPLPNTRKTRSLRKLSLEAIILRESLVSLTGEKLNSVLMESFNVYISLYLP